MERNTRIEEELFPFYALDALTDEERDEVERYIATNPEARARLAEVSLAAADFVASTAPVAPSAAVKSGLMARVEADIRAAEPVVVQPDVPLSTVSKPAAEHRPPAAVVKPKAPAEPRRSWTRFLVPALGAFAVLAIILSATTIRRLAQEVATLRDQIVTLEANSSALQTQIGTLEDENQTLRQELIGRDDLLAQFIAPGAVTVAIGDATGEHPTAAGSLTLNPAADSATLHVANLPPLDPGSTYQAWVIVGETPISVGMFTVDDHGDATHTVTGGLPDQIDAIGVSLEPAGGSETPTPGNIILLGTTS